MNLLFALPGWHVLRCPVCTLCVLVALPGTVLESGYDRSQFDAALAELRDENYGRVLAQIGMQRPLAGCRLLDVGCSSGWFLSAAHRAGCLAFGIEPDAYFARQAERGAPTGVRVCRGEFPQDLPAEWGSFDVITFNDVFEHLSDPLAVLAAVRQRLAPHGIVVLSLPMASGFAFHVGSLLYRLGMTGAMERIFQIHYPYPHLFCYAPESLTTLARRADFEAVRFDRLRSFSWRGSLARARMDHADSGAARLRQYLSALALLGFSVLEPWLPADNGLAILRPRLA